MVNWGLGMARWKPLPSGLDPAVVQFVVHLRQLKDASGLTLPQLSTRTGYSASSWERYLGGRTLPPLEAATALADVVGVDSVRLVAWYERAADAWRSGLPDGPAPGEQLGQSDTDAPSPEAETGAEAGTGDEPPGGGEVTLADELPPTPRRRLRTVLTASVAALAGAGIALLAVQPAQGSPACAPARPTPVPVVTKPFSYSCHDTRRDGQWYTGNSATSTDTVVVEMSGPEVVEVQCLLLRAGISPGGIDGDFGPLTESAVIQLQKVNHLDVDGQVGPQTWKALRR
jgi:transcriptional regulator with XRE-family HTH domain